MRTVRVAVAIRVSATHESTTGTLRSHHIAMWSQMNTPSHPDASASAAQWARVAASANSPKVGR
jgi:hypothetical protein